jgi:spore germination cell wall hydrolase CwlJ-like protein
LKIGYQDVLYMTATVWGEARGEHFVGKMAVAQVIINRARRPGWWSRQAGDGIEDDTLAAVCVDPDQFSCWRDKQAENVRRLAAGDLEMLSSPDYRSCLRAVLCALEAGIGDVTDGSTHYHAAGARPGWARNLVPVKVIGNHSFYNNVP